MVHDSSMELENISLFESIFIDTLTFVLLVKLRLDETIRHVAVWVRRDGPCHHRTILFYNTTDQQNIDTQTPLAYIFYQNVSY